MSSTTQTTASNGIAHLPEDILFFIFEAAVVPDRPLHPVLSDPLYLVHVADDIFRSKSDETLRASMHVCRSWRPVAARIFFASTYIPYTEGSHYSFVQTITATLEGHRLISEGWIRRLNIPYQLLAGRNVQHFIDLLKLCKNVHTLSVRPSKVSIF